MQEKTVNKSIYAFARLVKWPARAKLDDVAPLVLGLDK
jgi:hypothetical protein